MLSVLLVLNLKCWILLQSWDQIKQVVKILEPRFPLTN